MVMLELPSGAAGTGAASSRLGAGAGAGRAWSVVARLVGVLVLGVTVRTVWRSCVLVLGVLVVLVVGWLLVVGRSIRDVTAGARCCRAVLGTVSSVGSVSAWRSITCGRVAPVTGALCGKVSADATKISATKRMAL